MDRPMTATPPASDNAELLERLERRFADFRRSPDEGPEPDTINPDGLAASAAIRSLEACLAEAGGGWRPIETAPLRGVFLAIDRKLDLRKCWRHRPSSRTDEILTWARNGRFRATHWQPLPEAPAKEDGQ